jgi:hypothetical protein
MPDMGLSGSEGVVALTTPYLSLSALTAPVAESERGVYAALAVVLGTAQFSNRQCTSLRAPRLNV